MLLEGKTAIVTGASGGIGKAVAIALAKEGAAVAVHFHGNEEKALLVKKEIEEAGGKAEIFRANVADFEECNALVKAVDKTIGSIHILVNNLKVYNLIYRPNYLIALNRNNPLLNSGLYNIIFSYMGSCCGKSS